MKSNDLTTPLFSKLRRSDKLLLLLSLLEVPCKVQNIRERAFELGFRKVKKWNISDILSKTDGLAVNKTDGWELSTLGKDRLAELGYAQSSQVKRNVANDLRKQIDKFRGSQIRSFILQASKCYECELYRSAVIMSWVAAVAILRDIVRKRHLTEFNNCAHDRAKSAGRKNVKYAGYMDKVKESDFLEILHGISVIDKGVKAALLRCLDFRNQCSHPNDLAIGASMVANHLEVLILNVYNRYN